MAGPISEICSEGHMGDQVIDPSLEDVIKDGKFYTEGIGDEVCFTLKSKLKLKLLMRILKNNFNSYSLTPFKKNEKLYDFGVPIPTKAPLLRVSTIWGNKTIMDVYDYRSNNPTFQLFPNESGKYLGAEVADNYINALREETQK
ncbi:MAG: hypothetical protein JSW73_00685 [Candidatus Woesearchaeota archaeon]|nr:MAG: hypothetical protein JSW73_00685 [Candidatus Woesearchaeota archaeon]